MWVLKGLLIVFVIAAILVFGMLNMASR